MAPIKSSLAKSAKQLLGFFNTADLGLRGATQISRMPPPFTGVTGGNILDGTNPGNGYKYHTFTTSGSFIVGSTKTCQILMVGGGGSSGPYDDSRSGGGGAGGLIYWGNMPVPPGTYPVTIGAGGPKDVTGASGNGGDTIFGAGTPLHLVAQGGGSGGSGPRSEQTVAQSGGCGGGGAGFAANGPGGSGTQTTDSGIPANSRTYGFGGNGGTGQVFPGGGGGGGAAEPGNTDGDTQGGDGKQYPDFTGPLVGLPALNPLNGFYAGGGGGNGASGGPGAGGLGGAGSGAGGSPPLAGPGSDAVNNTGSGGGGGGGGPSGTGGAGGDGILVIRYSA